MKFRDHWRACIQSQIDGAALTATFGCLTATSELPAHIDLIHFGLESVFNPMRGRSAPPAELLLYTCGDNVVEAKIERESCARCCRSVW